MNITTEILTTTTPAPDECHPTDDEIDEKYNLTLHIVSIFVILIVSLLGASIAVVSARVKALRINPVIINVGKFFGSGIVLATGFIHMLPAATESLTDECLPESWNVYGAYAGLFTMLAALGMQLIEYLAHQRYHGHKVHSSVEMTNDTAKVSTETSAQRDSKEVSTQRDEVSVTVTLPQPHTCESSGHQHGVGFYDEAQSHKISTYLLEFGIALHSVLIGVALGTNVDEFIALFIALSFHQFFEGMALGAQIARLERVPLRSAIAMIVFFALTTPVGIAIGIGIHSRTYNPKSVASLLVNGILDSISAGILIYVALVNLITAEMGVGATAFHVLKTKLKVLYFLALYAGVGAMSVIGRWA